MLIETIAAAPGQVAPLLAVTGDSIANNIKNTVAPIVGILIAVFGLRYLFGENRSLAGFLSFILLGAAVWALIEFGQPILNGLGGLVKTILT